jgi:hypothetical protein
MVPNRILQFFIGPTTLQDDPRVTSTSRVGPASGTTGNINLLRAEARRTPPQRRTIAQWQYLCDLDKVRRGQYAVIDPVDASRLLYLTRREYVGYSRTALSTEGSITVVAGPTDTFD